MEKKINYMILNNKNVGISKIELNKDELNITDKTGKYNLHVTVTYDWKKINQVGIGKAFGKLQTVFQLNCQWFQLWAIMSVTDSIGSMLCRSAI